MSTSLRHRTLAAARPEPLSIEKTNPTSFSSKHYRSSTSSSAKQHGTISYRTLAIVILIALVPWSYQIKLSTRITQTRQKVASLYREQKSITREMEEAIATLQLITEETEKIEAMKKEILGQLRRQGDNIDVTSQEYFEAEQMESKYLTRVQELEDAIRTASFRHLQLYHPKGTVKVRFTLDSGKSFVVQLAPVEVAPHAASHFVRIVEAKLYDGLSLVHGNSGSGDIHAATISKSGMFDEHSFKKMNLTQVVFAEHYLNYENEKYSSKC